jgi:hypothetical protein
MNVRTMRDAYLAPTAQMTTRDGCPPTNAEWRLKEAEALDLSHGEFRFTSGYLRRGVVWR